MRQIWAILLCAAGFECTASPPAAAPRPPKSGGHIHYVVRPADDLSHLVVEACWRDAAPTRLLPGSKLAPKLVSGVTLTKRKTIAIDKSHGCVRWTTSLETYSSDIHRYPEAILFPPSLWMWWPPRGRGFELTARFDTPQGWDVSVPWPRAKSDPLAYAITDDTRIFKAAMAIGKMQKEVVVAGSCTSNVAVLGPPIESSVLKTWLEQALDAVAQPLGKAPAPRLQIVVHSQAHRQSGDAVSFGMALRGGGAAVQLWVRADAPLKELRQSWVPVHEMSHVLFPFVVREDAWLSEGLATYHQNVLRVRAGLMKETEAWESFLDGFKKGQKQSDETTVLKASQRMYETANFFHVYWAGTAFALLADYKLRKETKGGLSLNSVVQAIPHCCRQSQYTAKELLRQLDVHLKVNTLSNLYANWIVNADFPPLEEVLSALGVSRKNGRVTIESDARDASIRKAIFDRGKR